MSTEFVFGIDSTKKQCFPQEIDTKRLLSQFCRAVCIVDRSDEETVLIFKQHELSQVFRDAFERLEEIGIGELLHRSAIPMNEEIVVKKIIVIDDDQEEKDCS